MITRVLIADDEPLARERVRDLLAGLAPAVTCREVGDGDAALEVIREWQPEAVLLDVQMPRRDGLTVVRDIGADRMPPTIFVTAYDAHALQAFAVAAVDYLLKPFDDTRFAEAWQRLERAHLTNALATNAMRLGALLAATADGAASERAGAHMHEEPAYAERFLSRVNDRLYPVPVSDIRWLQADGNYVDLYTATGTHTIREPLSQVEARLDPARFVRIHRSVIVAIDQIRELQPWFGGDQVLVLHGGKKLRVSRTRRAALAARLEGRR